MDMHDKLDKMKRSYFSMENTLVQFKIENANLKSEVEVSDEITVGPERLD